MRYDEIESYVKCLRESAKNRDGGGVVRESTSIADAPGEVVARIRKGMPMAEFRTLADWLDMTDEKLAPLVGISRATFHRRRHAGHLEPPESERIVRFGRLMGRAVEVLGDEPAAREWLKSPAVAFGGETPLSFADTEVGAREVEYLLGRLEHGVFA